MKEKLANKKNPKRMINITTDGSYLLAHLVYLWYLTIKKGGKFKSSVPCSCPGLQRIALMMMMANKNLTLFHPSKAKANAGSGFLGAAANARTKKLHSTSYSIQYIYLG